MTDERAIVILDGARRTPRADMLIDNREPGLFSRYATTALGGLAIKATLENTPVDRGLIGHVIMGMASHSHRDSIYGAQGMAWRGGLDLCRWRCLGARLAALSGVHLPRPQPDALTRNAIDYARRMCQFSRGGRCLFCALKNKSNSPVRWATPGESKP